MSYERMLKSELELTEQIDALLSRADEMDSSEDERFGKDQRDEDLPAELRRRESPVFGQIKEARGFRRFLLRGLEKVQAEWALVCTGHNLLKLWRRASAHPA